MLNRLGARPMRFARYTLVLAPLLLIAARCVENESLYRDGSGNWVLVGEMYNDTGVQGAEMILGATLFDGAGNALVSGQGPICPAELSPNSLSSFEITFLNSASIPEPARHEFRVLNGKALDSPLPKLDVIVSGLAATQSGDTVTLTGTIRANRSYSGDFSGCAALYDGDGQVIRQITILGFGELPPSQNQELELPLLVVPDADVASVRFWLVGPGPAPFASGYAAVVSDLVSVN